MTALKQLGIYASPGRYTGAGDRAGAATRARAERCTGRAACAAEPVDRGALRPSPGHRMVLGRRRLPDRPEPADHSPIPAPRSSRPRAPRPRLRRPSADDDRPDEAPGALLLAPDDTETHVRGSREIARRGYPGARFAGEPSRPPPGEHEPTAVVAPLPSRLGPHLDRKRPDASPDATNGPLRLRSIPRSRHLTIMRWSTPRSGRRRHDKGRTALPPRGPATPPSARGQEGS